MASNVVNRQTIREALAAGLDAVFDSTWDVFSYGTDQFGGKARNIVISSGNTLYGFPGADDDTTAEDADIFFNIGVIVKYADDTASWTPQNSQDALDLGRKKVEDYIRDNRSTASWELMVSMQSLVGLSEDIAGTAYRTDVIPVKITILS